MAKPGHRKHIPRRVCVACRNVESKRELIRIVRTPEGSVVVDERGKLLFEMLGDESARDPLRRLEQKRPVSQSTKE